MINWSPFYFPTIEHYQPAIQFYTFPTFIGLGQSIIGCQSEKKEKNNSNCQEQNQEKILLKREDLQKESYESNKKTWTQEEDRKLIYLYQKKKLSWEEICKKIPGRNKKMCYSRYRRLQSGTKIQWNDNDNQKLKYLVQQHGQDWKLISQHFPSKIFIQNNNYIDRNSKQLKQHYKNYARPDIDKSQWSIDDDLRLIELINKYGKNWKLIEKEMFQRSLNQIKNRFFGKLKKLNTQLYGECGEN